MTNYIKYGLIILLAGFVYAQERPITSSGGLNYIIDYSIFNGNDSIVYVDFDLMLYTNNLFSKTKPSQSLSTTISITNNNKTSSSKFTNEIKPSSDTSAIEDVYLESWSEKFKYSEKYTIEIILSNAENTLEGKASFTIDVPARINEYAISDIQLLSKISDEKDGVQKAGKKVTPNPSRRFGLLNPVIYMYYELYNLPGNLDDEFNINYSIEDNTGKVVKSFPPSNFKKKGNTNAVLQGINSVIIPSGVYNLITEVTHLNSKDKVRSTKKIEIIQLNYIADRIKNNQEFTQRYGFLLDIIADKNDLEVYNKLKDEAKGEFLINYFKKYDPNPQTTENEFLEKVQQRFTYANEKFSWGNVEGFKSDRGIIIIKYGMPNDIQKYDSEANSVPYEVWNYNQEKSFYFVFADIRNNGRYSLIHSTKDGELSNSNWKNLLRKM